MGNTTVNNLLTPMTPEKETPTPKTVEEVVATFQEYCNDGYNGGKEGLRCTECDRKYRGESAIVQLCPVCKVRQALTAQNQAADERLREVTQEKIICAAVRFKDKVWRGHRHLYAMDAMHDELSYTMTRKQMHEQETDRDQGFVTSTDRYVDRAEAWDIAVKAGQLNDRENKTPGRLFSEDLW